MRLVAALLVLIAMELAVLNIQLLLRPVVAQDSRPVPVYIVDGPYGRLTWPVYIVDGPYGRLTWASVSGGSLHVKIVR